MKPNLTGSTFSAVAMLVLSAMALAQPPGPGDMTL